MVIHLDIVFDPNRCSVFRRLRLQDWPKDPTSPPSAGWDPHTQGLLKEEIWKAAIWPCMQKPSGPDSEKSSVWFVVIEFLCVKDLLQFLWVVFWRKK